MFLDANKIRFFDSDELDENIWADTKWKEIKFIEQSNGGKRYLDQDSIKIIWKKSKPIVKIKNGILKSHQIETNPYNTYYRDNFALKAIDLPNVETIENWAFENCCNLQEINLPNLKSLGDFAFYGCKSLSKAILPRVETIENCAFGRCSSLREVELSTPHHISQIDAFGYKTNTENISLILNENKRSEVYDSSRWSGYIWKEIQFVD